MDISPGFKKKILAWIQRDLPNTLYRPFELSGNPYKAKVMIVKPNPTQILDLMEVEEGDPAELDLYLSSSIDRDDFIQTIVDESYFKYITDIQDVKLDRDYKGSKNLVHWLKKEFSDDASICYLNANIVESTQDMKQLSKNHPEIFTRGQEVFSEVLQEFAPEVIVLPGKAAFEQFSELFKEQLEFLVEPGQSLKDLERAGVYALLHGSSHPVKIIVTKSLSTFSATSSNFEALRENLGNLLAE